MRDLPDFVQQLPPDMLKGINIYTGANIVLFKPNVYITVTMHTQDDYHFFIPATDAPPVLLEDKEILINKNRFAAVNPHTVMRLKLDRHTVTREYMSLSVKESFVRRIASQMGFEGEVVFTYTSNPCSHHIRQMLMLYEQEMERNPCALVDDCISTLLVEAILRRVKSNIPQADKDGVESRSYLDNAIAYMQEYYDANITLADICEEVSLSQYHFIRLFKRDTGKTPYEYLADIRMERARRLLEKEYPVSETAKLCGYISPAHFTTTFRQRFGISPSQYKKQ